MKSRVIAVFALAAVVAGGIFFVTRSRASADFESAKVKDLAAYLAGDHPQNRKLCALEELRTRTDSGVEGELAKVAKGKSTLLAIAACTQLGKKKTSTAKTDLKSILTDTSLSTSVRMGALSAIAYGFKDSGDLDYLTSKTKSDTKLSAQLTWLETNVYGK